MDTCAGPPHFGPTITSQMDASSQHQSPALLQPITQPSPGRNLHSSQFPFLPRSTLAWYPPLESTLPNYPPYFEHIPPSTTPSFLPENVSPTGTEDSVESTTTPGSIEYSTTTATTGYDGGGQVMTTPTPILIDPDGYGCGYGYGYGSVLYHHHHNDHHHHHCHHHDHDHDHHQVRVEPDMSMSPPFGATPDSGDGRDIVSSLNGGPPLTMIGIGIGIGGEDFADDEDDQIEHPKSPSHIPNKIVDGLGNQVMKSEFTTPASGLDSEARRPTAFPTRSARSGLPPHRDGSRPFPSSGGGARAKKPTKARTTVLSCAECRRLKLKCNRIFPCESCINRGYAYLCPDRTNPSARRAVGSTLAELEALREMVVRLRQESEDREREWKVEREVLSREWKVEREVLSRELEELRRSGVLLQGSGSGSGSGSVQGRSPVSSFEGQGEIVVRTEQPQAENIPLASPVDIAEEPPPVPPPPPPPPPFSLASLLEHVT